MRQVFEKMLELFDVPTKWTKGYYAKNNHGDIAAIHGEETACWCIHGGLKKVLGFSLVFFGDHHTIEEKVIEAIAKEINPSIKNGFFDSTIHDWNDNPHRRYEDIVSLLTTLRDKSDGSCSPSTHT